jgi:hypothetical protein
MVPVGKFMGGWNRIIGDIDDLRRRLETLRLKIIRLQEAGSMKSGRYRHGPKEYPTAFGRIIDRLRLECGWSYGDLSIVTGLKKQTILAHVNKGTRPHPETMKTYADVFSEKLRRQISVFDLQR